MVAVVSGSGLGLTTSSLAKLGSNGLAGNAANGRSGEQVYLNTTTGNLVVQENDETLFGTGTALSLIRTYNSQGQLNDGEGYGWQLSPQESLVALNGTVNTAGSTITKVFGDGAEVVYTYDTTQGVYVNSDNAGAADTLAFSTSTSEWTWTDGSGRNTETYNVDGQLVSSQDTAGNTTTYGYAGQLLTQITDASGQTTYLDYNGGNLADIKVVSNGVTQTRTRYAYDSNNRLTTVTVDLSPADNSVTDGNTYVTSYTYDGTSDRIATITQTDGSTISFTYEQVGDAYRVKTYATSAQGSGSTPRVNTLTYSDEGATPPAVGASTAQWNAAESLGSVSPANGVVKTALDAYGDEMELWCDGNQLQVSQNFNGSGGWSNWTTLNTLTSTVYQPSLSMDESGNAVIAWVQNDGTVNGLFVSTYNTTTASWTAPTELSSTSSSVWNGGAVTTATYGSQMAVSWEQGGQLYVSSLASNASTWSTPAAVNSVIPATADYNNVSLAMSGDGSIRAMWTQSDGTWFHPYINTGTFDSTTGAYQWGSAVELASAASNTPSAQMAFDAAGDGVAVWNAGGQLQSSTYSTASGTWSAPTVLDSGLSAVSADSNTLSLSMDRTSGDAVLSWVRNNGTVPAIYISRFSGTTHTWDAAPTLLESSSQPVGSKGGRVFATGISGSQAAVVWTQLDPDGLDYDLYASRWTGSSWGAPEQLAGLVNGMGARDPGVTVDRQGNVDVVWTQLAADSSALNVYGQFYAVSGPWNGAWLLGQGGPQVTPSQVAFDSHGNLFGTISWGNSLSEVRPNWATLTTLTSTVYQPSQSVDESGNGVVAWVQNDGNVDAVFVSTYNSAAGTWTAPVELSSTSSSVWNGGAVSTAIRGSQMAVSWEQDGQLYVSSIGPNTSTWSTPVAVNSVTPATGDYNNVSLAISGDGSVRAMWTQSDGTWFHPYMNAATLDSATGAYQWGGAVELESAASNTPAAQMAFDAAGNGVAVWNAGGQLQSSTYNVTSGTWSTPTVLDTGLSTTNSDSNPLSLSMDRTSGDAIVSWVRNNGTVPTIYVSRFSGTTHTWDATATALENSSEPVGSDSGKALTTGIFGGLAAVVWTQLDPNGRGYDLYVSRWTGSSWGAPEQLGGQIDGMGVLNPLVAVGPNDGMNDGILVTWSQYTPDGSARNIYFNIFNGGGAGASQDIQTDVTDALGQVTSYVHDSAGRLVSVLSPVSNGARLETDYTYDSAGNLASIVVDPQGLDRVTSFTYDAQGNLLTRTDADNNTITRTYSADNQLLTETQYAAPAPGQTPVALTTRYVYDAQDHLRFIVSADGRVEEYRYNTAGQRVADIKYAAALYDLSGLDAATAPTLAQLTAWVGAQSAQSLSATERVDYTYDFRGQLSTATAYGTVDSTGAGVASTAAATQYVYDQRGNLLQQIDPRGSASAANPANSNLPYATTYTYDGLGRVLSTTQWIASGSIQTTTTQYADANQRTVTTYANGLVSTSLYDGTGALISVTRTGPSSQALGATTYTYDADNQLRMVTDADGVRSYLLYDALGRKVADIDGTGALTAYVYDTAGEVVKTTHYADALTAGQLASLTDAQGNPTQVSLADLLVALPTTVGRAQDEITRTVYDTAGLKVYSIDATGAVTQYLYDGAERLTDTVQYATTVSIDPSVDVVPVSQLTFAAGGTSPAGLTASADDRHVRYFYDADGHLVGTLDGAGYLTESIYDGAGQLSEQIAYATVSPSASWATGTLDALRPAGAALDEITHYFYDDAGRQVGVLDAGGYLTANQYYANGQLQQSVRYDQVLTYSTGASVASLKTQLLATTVSHSTSYLYDGAGRLTQQTNYEGTIEAYQYDAVGDRTSTDEAQGTSDDRLTQARYDALGRVIAQLTPEGSAQIAAGMNVDTAWSRYAVHYTYDNDGRQVSSTDQNGLTTYTYYDTDGRVRFTVDGYGRVSESRYNALGQLTDTITYEGRIATSGLTGGLVNSAITTAVQGIADATQDGHTSYTYDLVGQVASSVTADGESVTHTYNAFGEEKHRAEQIDATHVLTHDYTYDTRGLLKHTVSDASGVNATEDRGYDAFGQLTSVTDADGHTTITDYDTLGRVKDEKDALTNERSFTYDAFARLKSETDYTNLVANATGYTYDDVHLSVTETTAAGVVVTTVHNREGQIASVTNGDTAVAGVVADTHDTKSYQYDANGRLKQVSDTSTLLGANVLEAHSYDAAGRVTQDVDAYGTVTSYSYDPANPTVTRMVDPTGQALVTTDQYDGQGRLVHEVDANGRVTDTAYYRNGAVQSVKVQVGVSAGNPSGVDETDYTYDGLGHVLTKIEGAGNTNPRRTLYAYDTSGREISQTVDPTSLGGTLNLVTQYKYDAAGNITRTIDAAGNSTWYVYDADNHLRYTINTLNAQTLQGAVTEQIYDVNGRVTSTRHYATAISVSGFGDQVTTLNVPSAQPGVDQYTQSVYDQDGREVYTLQEVILSPAAGVQELVTQKVYDARGDVTCQIEYSKAIAQGAYSSLASVQSALNTAGNIAGSATAADRAQWSAYDARGRVIFTVDAAGDVVHNSYDNAGDLTSSTAYATRYTGTVFDGASLTTWANTAANQSANDRTTRTWYDSTGRQRFVLDPQGYLHETRYLDSARQKIEIQYAAAPASVPANATTAAVVAIAAGLPASDPNNTSSLNETTTYQYDTVGQLRQVTQVLGSTSVSESYDYDALGNKVSYTNKDNQTWTYQYDANHRLTLETAPAVQVTTVSPASSANAAALNPSASVSVQLQTYYQYDALGNLKSRTDAYGRPEARTTTYDYDALGHQIATHSPGVGVYNASADNLAAAGLNVPTASTLTGGVLQSLTSQVSYDALGNAVVDQDVGGGYSQKLYDSMGRVLYEVDALGQVTGYTYNAFGDRLTTTRYANALASPPGATPLTLATVQALTQAPNSQNRTITTTYDGLGRAVRVAQPTVFNYDSVSGATGSYTPVTRNTYDAFGDLIEQDQLLSSDEQHWSSTYYFYDHDARQVMTVQDGRRAATDAALWYVTTQQFDANGNLTDHLEYAQPNTSWNPATANGAPPALPQRSIPTPNSAAPALGYDRETSYTYDQLNRKISQTQNNVQYDIPVAGTPVGASNGVSTGSDTKQVGSVTTSYQYDAVGNQTVVTVLQGTSVYTTSYTYYDALGRVVGSTQAARDLGDGTVVLPYTSIARDAFGDEVVQTQYFNGLTSATAQVSANPAQVPQPTADANRDRTTYTEYDALGRVIAQQDPMKSLSYRVYTARGDLAKSWQLVTNTNDGTVDALVNAYRHDAIGQQIDVYTPTTNTPGAVEGVAHVHSTYDTFGELTGKTTQQLDTSLNLVAGAPQGNEYDDYDNAGRLWRTNSGDGINKVFLYNLAGQQTAEFKSQTVDLKNDSRVSGTDAAAASVALMGQGTNGSIAQAVQRTDSLYDVVGRLIGQREVTFTSVNSQDAVPPTSFAMRAVQGTSKPVLYWSAPGEADITATFTYSGAAGSGSLNVIRLDANTFGVDLSALPSLNAAYTYQISYTRSGDTAPFAVGTGTVSLNTTSSTGISGFSTNGLGGVGATPSAPVSGSAPTSFSWTVSDGSTSAQVELKGASGASQMVTATATSGSGGMTYTVNFGGLATGAYTYYVTEFTNGVIARISSGTLNVLPVVTTLSAVQPVLKWAQISPLAPTSSGGTVTVNFSTAKPSSPNQTVATIKYRVTGTSTWSTEQDFNLSGSTFQYALSGLSLGTQYDYYITNYDMIPTVPGRTAAVAAAYATGTFTASGNPLSLSGQSSGLLISNGAPYAVSSLSISASTPTVGNTNIAWSWTGANPGLVYQYGFNYGPVGGGTTSLFSSNISGTQFSVNLAGLTVGTTYNYSIDIQQNAGGVIIDGVAKASGQFQVTSTGAVVILSQNDTTLSGGSAQYLGGITSSGNSVIWAQQASSSSDTVTATYFNLNTNATGSLTVHTSDGTNYTASLLGLPTGFYQYTINYTHAGASSPYLEGAGNVNATTTVPTSFSGQTNVTAITGIGDGSNGRVQWSPAAGSGDTVVFQFLAPGHGWQTGTAVPTGNGYYVDLSAYTGSIQYVIKYMHAGFSTPYLYSSGSFTITVTTTTTASDANTTLLPGATVTPTLSQTLDRWGDVLSVTNVPLNATTYYAYNQDGERTITTQPATQVVSTLNGTMSAPGSVSAQQQVFYDIFGHQIGTGDEQSVNGQQNISTDTVNAAGETTSATNADVAGNSNASPKRYVYDAFGELLQVTDELGFRTRNAYDADGHLSGTAQEYVKAGDFGNNIASAFPAVAQNLVVRAYTYDAAGRRLSETSGEFENDGTPQTTRYWYDLQGNLLVQRDPLDLAQNMKTSYRYDLAGHKISQTDQLGNSMSWQYDFYGHLLAHTDLGGVSYQYSYANNYDGLLQQQTSTVPNSSGVASAAQSIAYSYDAAGHLIEINENTQAATDSQGNALQAVSRDTKYAYDAAGRQVREQVTVNGVQYQDTRTTYDALGRIIELSDPRYRTSYSYDAEGNRTHVATYYFDQTGTANVQNLWYTYDAMNRVLVSQGALSGSTVAATQTQGVQLTYDAKGERQTATDWDQVYSINVTTGATLTRTYSYAPGWRTETYTYDGLGRLLTSSMPVTTTFTNANNISTSTQQNPISVRSYDRASHELTENDTVFANLVPTSQRVQTSTYDQYGVLYQQTTSLNGKDEFAMQYGESTSQPAPPVSWAWVYGGTNYGYTLPTLPAGQPIWSIGYDAAGNLRGYTLVVYDTSQTANDVIQYQSTHSFDLRQGESYQVVEEAVATTNGALGPGNTIRTYDSDGELVQYTDTQDATKNRYFVNNASGEAMEEVQGSYGAASTAGSGAAQLAQALNELKQGIANNDKAQHLFYAQGQEVGSFENTGSGFAVHFDVNYTPVSQEYPTAAPSTVVVQQGDTLQVIAARVFGDASLWYVIAEANGYTDVNTPLSPGSSLVIPNHVVSLKNTATTFKPYDPATALGDTTPTQPVPPPQSGGGCGTFGMIIVAIVAIVATIYTAGAAAEAFGAVGSTATTTFGAGLSAVTGASGLAGVGAAIVGAAVGSVVSQGIAIAIGEQSSFSWKAVAAAAISAGIGGGIGAVSGLGVVADAALNAAINQEVDVALGLQKSFSWQAVAAAAVAAPVANELGQKVGSWVGGELDSSFAASVAQKFTTNAVNQVAYASFTGGRLNYAQLAADSFGNALGTGLAQTEAAAPPAQYGLTAEQNAELEQQFSAGARDQAAADTAQIEGDTARYLSGNAWNVSVPEPTLQNITFDPGSVPLANVPINVAAPADTSNPAGIDSITAAEYAARQGRSVDFLADQAAALSPPAAANDSLPEVVVTAQRPGFWSALGGDLLHGDFSAAGKLVGSEVTAGAQWLGAQLSDTRNSDAASYIPGPIPSARYHLGIATVPANSVINLINDVGNIVADSVGTLTEPIAEHQGEITSVETGLGPAGSEAILATTGIAGLSTLIRTETALNEVAEGSTFTLASRGVTDPALQQRILDAGLKTELLDPEATPATLARFDKLFVDTVDQGKSFSGRLGNIDTRVATINQAAELEQAGYTPRFEFPVDVGSGQTRFVDLAGIDSTGQQATQYFQFVKMDSAGNVIRPDELVAAAQIEAALNLSSGTVKLVNTAK